MGMSMKSLDKRLLEETNDYIKHLTGSRSEPEVRQTAWLWDFYHRSKNLLHDNRVKKLKNVKPDAS